VERQLRDAIIAEILRTADVDRQVAAALSEVEVPDCGDLVDDVAERLAENPDMPWRDCIEAIACELVEVRRSSPDNTLDE
jgi:hypothetical protein